MFIGCIWDATKHIISSYEEFTPQNSPFELILASLIHSSVSLCVHVRTPVTQESIDLHLTSIHA